MEEVDNDVAKEMQHVVGHGGGNSNDVDEDEVHDVEEAEVHDVHDFELEDVEEDEDVDEGEDENVDDEEDVDEDVYEDEYVDEDVECEPVSEESLVDVSLQCDIGTSKGNVREEPCTLVGECSRTTDNDSIDDVRGLSDIE
ncbi:acidic leucine-rich nuclear phosphoprotein 32 family member B-like [Vigna umbellata]|uniref:acidic leucine-rich nuclear phosphoprotein 32 family member B-like n=1 Tax=Vigna umbellata TaxID=87088 RepID=UPI001F5FAD3C|nr:acidic leucine-rich nuclear phosphoprotein 32 family member B-like [Vigna umbellata]